MPLGRAQAVQCFEMRMPLPLIETGHCNVDLQYVVEAIVYYNPLKIFLLFSLICVAIAAIMMIVSLSFSIVTGIMLAIAISMAGVVVFGLGMLAVLLKQIMDKA